MKYLERKSRFAAVRWDGSNLSEVETFVAALPLFDPQYGEFTNVNIFVDGDHLVISWDHSVHGSGQNFFYQHRSDWVVEGAFSNQASDLVTFMDGSGNVPLTLSVIEP